MSVARRQTNVHTNTHYCPVTASIYVLVLAKPSEVSQRVTWGETDGSLSLANILPFGEQVRLRRWHSPTSGLFQLHKITSW